MKYLLPFFLVLILPLVRALQKPDDLLKTCPPGQLRILDEVLSCGSGRPLAPLERLSLGFSVHVDELSESDWQALIGKKATARLLKRSREQEFICRYRLSELGNILSPQLLARLPPQLRCLHEINPLTALCPFCINRPLVD